MYKSDGAVNTARSLVKAFSKRRCLRFQRSFVIGIPRQERISSSAVARGSDYDERVRSLKEGGDLTRCYPRFGRFAPKERGMPASHFLSNYESKLFPGETDHDELVQISGRVKARRTAGSRLVFFDVESSRIDGPAATVQVVCNQSVVNEKSVQSVEEEERARVALTARDKDPFGFVEDDFSPIGAALNNEPPTTVAVTEEAFKSTCQMIRVGDWIATRGYPHRTRSGELSLLATHLPTLHAPRLHQLPDVATDMETINRRSHVKMLMQPRIKDVFRMRMLVEDALDWHCKSQGLTRVRTPIIGASSGGATAEPFETRAKELSDEKLTLRIAPELYLKRLMVGDMTGVYEIGPAFRNEGIDATHNPEFTICEYYKRYTTVRKLMLETEALLATIAAQAHAQKRKYDLDLEPSKILFKSPFRYLRFLPTLTEHLQEALVDPSITIPDLEAESATDSLIDIYARLDKALPSGSWKGQGMPLPSNPTLPRLLDDLSSIFLEPLAIKPTWITDQPACLAPLAKSHIDPHTGQHVSLRAELFINGREYVNCYEEENSPFEQRRKFLLQREHQGQEKGLEGIEESYIEALEWGLPPTGGWGCGVDRLVMLSAGVDRIADVLPFGTLRNVVAMGKPLRK